MHHQRAGVRVLGGYSMNIEYICPPVPYKILPPEAVLAVGFGVVIVEHDDEVAWIGDDENMTVADIDAMVALAPHGKWTIFFDGPLSDSTYQLGPDGWVLVAQGRGFA